MTEIPETVLAQAKEYVRANHGSTAGWSEVIARAIMDERKRCALVAFCHSDDRPRRYSMDWNEGYLDGCKGAAEAIRRGDT